MALVQPTSENKFIKTAINSIVAPCSKLTVINQGSRMKLVTNLLVVTNAATDDWCGVANFANPPAPLGDTVDQGEILLKDNVVYFDAPATAETFNYGATVYAYDDATNYYSGAVTTSSSGAAKAVGIYVGASGIVSGAGVKVAVKILPTQLI